MLKRTLEKTLREYGQQFPAIALLGPRQSGKTTLAKETFKNHTYISLENSDTRALALSDPRLFLENIQINTSFGVILDEFQHVPDLLSYLQEIIDSSYRPGYFILTGSQNFLLNEAISQTLAGRIGILTLLPFSSDELKQADLLPETLEITLFKGSYPRIYDQHFSPLHWYPSYIQTYIERDIRQIKNVTNLALFQKFIQLCAGRIGQLLNVTSLANDCGITVATVKSWLSLLEASYIIFLLHPYHNNFSKRLIKSPKLYFYDTGLACSLLEIESAEQLLTHYLRGGIVESYVISELQKYYYHQGRRPKISFWRESNGKEIDCILEKGLELFPVEIKAAKTFSPSFFTHIKYWQQLTGRDKGFIIYAGNENFKTSQGTILSWKSITDIFPAS